MALRFKKLNSEKLGTVKKVENLRVKWNAACRSNFQKQVKKFFEKYWAHHQVFEELPIPGTTLRCDLVNLSKRIIVESNGMQHDRYNKFFHGKNPDNLLEQFHRDEKKRTWAEQNNFRYIEIYEADMPLTPEFLKKQFDLDL